MRLPTILLLLMVFLVAPAVNAQTPASGQEPGVLMQLTLTEVTPDFIMTIGVIRTIQAAGSSRSLNTGSGSSLHYVESGSVVVAVTNGAPAQPVRGGSTDTATPAPVSTGGNLEVFAGDGFLLGPESTAEIRTDGADRATVLDLLAAPSASDGLGEGVTQEILVRQKVTLPQPPLTVTLSRVTLAPGDRLETADEPAFTFYAAALRSQAFNLSGQGVNRLAVPIDAYVLVIAP